MLKQSSRDIKLIRHLARRLYPACLNRVIPWPAGRIQIVSTGSWDDLSSQSDMHQHDITFRQTQQVQKWNLPIPLSTRVLTYQTHPKKKMESLLFHFLMNKTGPQFQFDPWVLIKLIFHYYKIGHLKISHIYCCT